VKATSRRFAVHNNEKEALAEAIRLLWPLTKDIVLWETDTNSPEQKLRGAVALVEQALTEAEAALKDCPLRSEIDKAAADALVFVQLARQKAIPELQQVRPRVRKSRGQPATIARNNLIASTVKTIQKQFGMSPNNAIKVVRDVLPKLIPDKLSEERIRKITYKKGQVFKNT
jgi:hypothetical protein